MFSIDRLSYCASFANLNYFVRGDVDCGFAHSLRADLKLIVSTGAGFANTPHFLIYSVRYTARHRTSFRRSARCGAVAPRVLSRRQHRSRPVGHLLRCILPTVRELARAHFCRHGVFYSGEKRFTMAAKTAPKTNVV